MGNRCLWAQRNALMQDYHDKEWCRVSSDDRYIFEMLVLEGAQAGLSWNIVLSKRDAYREAFHQFDVAYCAELTDEELSFIKENFAVIKHGSKLQSVRTNALAILDLSREWGSFAAFLWSFTDGKSIDNKWDTDAQIPAQSALSVKLSKELKKRGFKFVGPVTTYSFMQAIGMVNDHIKSCDYRMRS
ncbi:MULTISPECIES: DNA-3-methyladenine glycosylase I [Planococcus]|uniref:3-methyladenine DNA glycosylase n=1 Tax=Planococcus faecalis TaxID=1598147 RepID=A0ABM6ISC5_9BACL|nr:MULTISPECIES: DNA-3-methyladenine glycosylase I [Planococcus]AQU79254.1 3-methyladenine DNA glycosylase [Planococcus faecalis]MDJ0332368.1 DNA-3-methyladenine glycosylase I [Planococcus sp. S3-L1]OHX52290.1 3-methyladenine DNA glycosylase [Planococcus faecalis]